MSGAPGLPRFPSSVRGGSTGGTGSGSGNTSATPASAGTGPSPFRRAPNLSAYSGAAAAAAQRRQREEEDEATAAAVAALAARQAEDEKEQQQQHQRHSLAQQTPAPMTTAARTPGWRGATPATDGGRARRFPPFSLTTPGPTGVAIGGGNDDSHSDMDGIRSELHELRLSNAALQQTNNDLRQALSSVTERGKMLQSEHARFLNDFRSKMEKGQSKLVGEKQAMKESLDASNTRLKELEQSQSHLETERNDLAKQLEQMTLERDHYAASTRAFEEEKSIWIQKESEYQEINNLLTRNLDELRTQLLSIQHEREGWHEKWLESQQELEMSQKRNQELEEVIRTHAGTIDQLNASLLTSQEEVINLTQTLATHLEQIGTLSTQNRELHETLVKFTASNPQDEKAVEEAVDTIMSPTGKRTKHGNSRIAVLRMSPEPAVAASPHPSSSPGPFGSPASSPRHRAHPSTLFSPSARASADDRAHPHPPPFLQTPGLSTLHLPAAYTLSKLHSFILWIMEHKVVLENMQRRKEKLRKEIEAQVVVEDVEALAARQHNTMNDTITGAGTAMASPHASPSRSRSRTQPHSRSASPLALPFTPARRRAASPPPLFASPAHTTQSQSQTCNAAGGHTLLLPSLLQHTLHDLHELTHLINHDALQLRSFEETKSDVLFKCSSAGFETFSEKLQKSAWILWRQSFFERRRRKERLCNLMQQAAIKMVARSFTHWRIGSVCHEGHQVILDHSNELKTKILGALLRRSNSADRYTSRLGFLEWRSVARRNKARRQRVAMVVAGACEKQIELAWKRWKENVLELRYEQAVEDAQTRAEALAIHIRQQQLQQVSRMISRQLFKHSSDTQRHVFRSWKAWAQHRRQRKRHMLHRIVFFCAGRGLQIQAWSAWKDFVRRHSEKTAQLRLMDTEQEGVRELVQQRDATVAVYKHLSSRLRTFQIFHLWRMAYSDTQWLNRESQWRRALSGQKAIQLRTLIKLHSHTSTTPIFLAWRNWVRTNKEGRRRSAHKVMRHLLHHPLARAWRTWKDFVETDRVECLRRDLQTSKDALVAHKRSFVDSLIRRWRSAQLNQAFQTLRERTRAQRSHKRLVLERTLKRMDNVQLFNAFRQWKATIDAQHVYELQQRIQRQKNVYASRVVHRWQMSSLVPAFNTWRQNVRDRKQRRRTTLERMCKKLVNGALWRGFRAWRAFAESESVAQLHHQWDEDVTNQKRKRAQEWIHRWRLAALIPAFRTWRLYVATRKERRLHLLDQTLRRMSHAALWKAFRTWTMFTEKEKIAELRANMDIQSKQASEQRTKLAEHMLMKWRMNRTKERFIQWKHFAQSSRAHKRTILERTLRHLTHGILNRGWNSWRHFIEQSRMAQFNMTLNETKRSVATQAIRKWRLRILTAPFIQWREVVNRKKSRKLELIDRVLRRMVHAGLWRAWRCWNEYADAHRLHVVRTRLTSNVNELNSQLMVEKQKRLAAMIKRWRGASLSTRFNQWRIWSKTQRSKRRIRLDQVLRRIAWNNAWRGMNAWKEFVRKDREAEAARNARQALAQQAEANQLATRTARQKHLISKTLDRMCNLLLFSGWRTWKSYVAASIAHDLTMQKRALEAQTASLREAQAQLIRQHTATLLARQQALVDKTLRRMAFSQLYKALRHWRQQMESQRVGEMRAGLRAKEQNLKLQLLATKIAARRQLTLRPVMERWRRWSREQRAHKKELLEKTCRRMVYIQLWQAIRHWKHVSQSMAVEELRQQMDDRLIYQKQQRARELIRSWRHRSVQPAFIAWRSYVDSNHRRKRQLKQIFMRLDSIQMYRAFRQWKVWRESMAKKEALVDRQRQVIDRTLRRLTLSSLYRALKTWSHFSERSKQASLGASLKLLQSKALTSRLGAILRGTLKNHFLEWLRYVRSQRKERGMVAEMSAFHRQVILDRTIRRMLASNVSRAFQQWRTWSLRSRLMMNDRLAEYSALILQLRSQSEADAVKLHELMSENQRLRSSLLSMKHKQQTLALLNEQQREQKAIQIGTTHLLARSFHTFHAHTQQRKHRKHALGRAMKHVHDTLLLRAIQAWKERTMESKQDLMKRALEAAKKQLDQCLGKVWSLESQLASSNAAIHAAESKAHELELAAQASEVSAALDKQMPSEREVALAKEVDTLAAKLQLMLKEVKERGQHIQFLSAENQRLSTIVKAGHFAGNGSDSGHGTPSLGLGSSSMVSSIGGQTTANDTLNLTSSFMRSRGAAQAASVNTSMTKGNGLSGVTPARAATTSTGGAPLPTTVRRFQPPYPPASSPTPTAPASSPIAAAPHTRFYPSSP